MRAMPSLVNFSGDLAPRLVPGEIRAYRVWRPSDPFEPPRFRAGSPLLRSAVRDDYLRPYTGPLYHARCEKTLGVHSRRLPMLNCSCGFYGVYVGGLSTLAALMFPSTWYLPTFFIDYVIGSVAMSGRVLLSDNGLIRAERMRIEALCRVSSSYEAMRLGETYSVPGYSDFKRFQSEFPLNDVTDLLGPQDTLAAYRKRDQRAVKWGLRRFYAGRLLRLV